MTNALMGWQNGIMSSVLRLGNAEPALGVAQLQDPNGAASIAWQTQAGVVASGMGAWLASGNDDGGGNTIGFRAFLLARTNLTAAATVRWRVYDVLPWVSTLAPDFSADFSAGAVPAGWTFSRASTGTYVDAAGVVQTAAAGVARFEADPISGLKGVLVEPAATNDLLSSAAVGDANWSSVLMTMTPNDAAAPDGSVTGSLLTSSGGTLARVEQTLAVASEQCATSFFVKYTNNPWVLITVERPDGGGRGWFNIQTGKLGSTTLYSSALFVQSAIRALGNGWYRISAAVSMSTSAAYSTFLSIADGDISQNSVAGQTVLAWGGQSETNGQASSYIPTAAAAVTRAADSLSVPAASVPVDAATLQDAFTIAATIQAPKVFSAVATLVGPTVHVTGGSGDWYQFIYSQSAIVRGAAVGVGSSAVTVPLGEVSGVASSVVSPGTTEFATEAGSFAPSYLAIGAFTQIGLDGGTVGGIVSRLDLFASALSVAQMQAWLSSRSTAIPVYDTGSVAAGVIGGFGQSVIVAPSEVAGAAVRCDIDDPTNPDGFINVALAFAGPVWEMTNNISGTTTLGHAEGGTLVTTRGGQVSKQLYWTARRSAIALATVRKAEVWPSLMELDAACRDGRNTLFVPAADSADVGRETIYGLLAPGSDVGGAFTFANVRTWSGTITERL